MIPFRSRLPVLLCLCWLPLAGAELSDAETKELLRTYLDGDAAERSEAAKSLATRAPENRLGTVIAALIDGAEGTEGQLYRDIEWSLYRAARRDPDTAFPMIRKLFRARDASLKALGLGVADAMPDHREEMIDLVTRIATRDRNAAFRARGIATLARFVTRDDDALLDLIGTRLARDREGEVKTAAITALRGLSNLHGEACAAAIAPFMADRDEEIAKAAVEAFTWVLNQDGNPGQEHLARFFAAFGHPRPAVVAQALDRATYGGQAILDPNDQDRFAAVLEGIVASRKASDAHRQQATEALEILAKVWEATDGKAAGAGGAGTQPGDTERTSAFWEEKVDATAEDQGLERYSAWTGGDPAWTNPSAPRRWNTPGGNTLLFVDSAEGEHAKTSSRFPYWTLGSRDAAATPVFRAEVHNPGDRAITFAFAFKSTKAGRYVEAAPVTVEPGNAWTPVTLDLRERIFKSERSEWEFEDRPDLEDLREIIIVMDDASGEAQLIFDAIRLHGPDEVPADDDDNG